MMNKKLILILLVIVTMIMGSACGNQSDENKNNGNKNNDIDKELKSNDTFFAMDTTISLIAYGQNAETGIEEGRKVVETLDSTLSTGNEKSQVSKLNRDGRAVFDKTGKFLMKKSLNLYKETSGFFDISIYPVMESWGFTTKNYKVPTDDELQDVIQLVNASKIDFDNKNGKVSFKKDGMKIDFGGIAKGYTSEQVIKAYKKAGVKSGLVNLGGNVQTLGKKPSGKGWKVAIQNPNKNKSFLGVLESSDEAIISSGDYERFFVENGKRYHHIIDPRTGKPTSNELQSVTIVSKDGTIADGLSTSLFIMGKDKAIEFWKSHSKDFQIILFTKDEKLIVSDGLEKRFSSDAYEIEIINENDNNEK